MAHSALVRVWHEVTAPVMEDMRSKNAEKVAAALDTCKHDFIRNIGASGVLCAAEVDEATKESMWRYLQSLTALASILSGGGETSVAIPAPPAAAGAAAAPAAPPAGKPADVLKSITTAMPEIFATLNNLMKDESSANPLGAMLRQMMQPDALQTGLANNVASNLLSGANAPVMSQVSAETGMGAEEILKKLRKLEYYEKRHAQKRR